MNYFDENNVVVQSTRTSIDLMVGDRELHGYGYDGVPVGTAGNLRGWG